MGLHRLDFLSNAPQNFIFQNKSNKTNFGGFLTLILIIITLIIFVFYLIFYITEQSYTIQYIHYEKYLNQNEILKKINSDKYNPYFDFLFEMVDTNDNIIPNNFVLINSSTADIIPRNTITNSKVSDINIIIAYKCDGTNETDPECHVPIGEFVFAAQFHGFILDHQNKNSPLYKSKEDGLLNFFGVIFPKNPSILTLNWRTIKYNTDAGFLKLWYKIKGVDEEDQKDIGLTGYNTESLSLKNVMDDKDLIEEIEGTRYRMLGRIIFNIDFNHYDEYNRIKISFWDSLSNVCSLSLTIFNGLSFFLTGFYSNSFDNYKIIEKILSDKKPEKKEKPKKIELTNISNKTDPLIQEREEEKEIINTNNKEEEKFEEENQKYNIEDNEEDNEKDNNIQKRNLPKLRFIDFIFNNVYSSKRCKNNRQEIISICNELISKYNSIENTLYFQLKLENLLKDYKWNNPELGKLDNNQLIIQLKNLVSIYDDN